MTEYDQRAVIEGEQFVQMRADSNRVLQKLLKNMVEKNTNDGTLTIKIDVSFVQEFVPIPHEQRKENGPESRRVLKPQFKHKISSTMQVKDDASGNSKNETMELVWDEETGSYILTPVTGEQQMNIFDVMKENEKEEPEGETEEDDGNEEDDSQKQVEGRRFMSLPGPGLEEAMNAPETDDEAEDDVIEAEYREVEADGNGDDLDVPEEDGGDITVPDDTDIGEYEYQEPGEDDEEELIDEEEEPSWD